MVTRRAFLQQVAAGLIGTQVPFEAAAEIVKTIPSELVALKPSFRSFASAGQDFISFNQAAKASDVDIRIKRVLGALSYHFEFVLRAASIGRVGVDSINLHSEWQNKFVPALFEASKNARDVLYLCSPFLTDIVANNDTPEIYRIRAKKLASDLEALIRAEIKGVGRQIGASHFDPFSGIKEKGEESIDCSKPSIRSIAATVDDYIDFVGNSPKDEIFNIYKPLMQIHVEQFKLLLVRADEERGSVHTVDLHRDWQNTQAVDLMDTVREALVELNHISRLRNIDSFVSETTFKDDSLNRIIAEFTRLVQAEDGLRPRNPGPYWQEPFSGIRSLAA